MRPVLSEGVEVLAKEHQLLAETAKS
jgi:hypothetical protein